MSICGTFVIQMSKIKTDSSAVTILFVIFNFTASNHIKLIKLTTG